MLASANVPVPAGSLDVVTRGGKLRPFVHQSNSSTSDQVREVRHATQRQYAGCAPVNSIHPVEQAAQLGWAQYVVGSPMDCIPELQLEHS